MVSDIQNSDEPVRLECCLSRHAVVWGGIGFTMHLGVSSLPKTSSLETTYTKNKPNSLFVFPYLRLAQNFHQLLSPSPEISLL